MMALILRWFGYARVPSEAVELIVRTRLTWEKFPRHVQVGEALRELERLLRSTR